MPLRAIFDWLKKPSSASDARPATAPTPPAEKLPARLGHYAITKRLGQGGMGVVYAAHDERLHRTVAVKTMAALAADETARMRFWREARAAASVNHPNICQIYEIGEDGGQLFIAMELLEGAPLSDQLGRGPMLVGDTVSIGLGMLGALSALHARGVVHRDLKPSNVFLTPHGVKLLDFGLARPTDDQMLVTGAELTRAGTVLGTPRYMAPEQVVGDAIDARTDLFAAGAILFEMLAGRPAFNGRTVVEIAHATMYEQPPALTGPAAATAVDRVIRRALAKKPADRPATADAMADELRATRDLDTGHGSGLAQALTRLVALPFRVLRPDPETDFLAFSLPDAILSSLSMNDSLIVRASATAARFASETPDFKALAAEVDVDRVVTGTLLRSGDEVRVVVQLVDTPSGTLVTSHTVQAPLGDLFRLQDDIARRVVEALSPPLTPARGGVAERRTTPVPAEAPNARAYELYLRANDLARTYDGLARARDLYERAVVLDPSFAPAWARLGRCHRVIGKYIEVSPDSDQRAEDAFRRALELNPRLTIAHKMYANLEADLGQAARALVRLIGEAIRHGNDPELFAGLVHACRYCGLFDESIAAHDEARRLDPNIATSVEQTVLMTGDTERLFALIPSTYLGGDDAIRAIGLGLAGRFDEARTALDEMGARPNIPVFERWATFIRAWVDRRIEGMIDALPPLEGLKVFSDPEATFRVGWLLCDAGAHELGFARIERAVRHGFFVSPTLATAPPFDGIRQQPAFQSLLADAEAGRQRALAAFREAGSERLLGR